jgi:uncharacterized protein YkwD
VSAHILCDSDEGPGDGDGGGAGDVPAGAHCDRVAEWGATATGYEEEVLRLTNEARTLGHDCGAEGHFEPTTPLEMDARLRCSSRLHTVWMATVHHELSHDNTDTGETPFDRMSAAGYPWNFAAENIAAGQRSPREVVDTWLESDGHCANMMSPEFEDMGVGYVMSDTAYWTINFGRSGH